MANRIKIIFPSNPTAFYLMSFSVFNVALGYSKWLSKTFVSGTPSAVNHVQIGATLADTMVNLLANLNANDLDGISTFEASGTNGFYVNLSVAASWSFANLTDPGSTITTLSTETITTLEPITLSALNYNHLSIRIFDTYVNERVLIEELASATACQINWNGGDDLYKEFVSSECVFNMLVPEADDAHFIHLFSGDEQRYRVELIGIDAEENEQLIWQGFLLPDQYNEPYQQVSFFVDFTATDMVASMKGKYLKPWFYQNTIPIAQVFAYCLSATGLNQNIIVKPSVVPDADLYLWNAIGVDMRAFADGEKYDDCFTIIEKLLKSNVLSLTNFRGYWWLEGIHRKSELETTNYQFDVDGNRVADIVVNKNVVDCAGSLQPTPNFTAVTPWKQVNVNFDLKGTKNLYSTNVVALDKPQIYSTQYTSGNYVGPAAPTPVTEVYNVGKIKDWKANLNSDFFYVNSNFKRLMWKTLLPSGFDNYNYTEAMALNNYLECKEQPFVKPGVLYEIEAEFFIERMIVSVPNTPEVMRLKLANGDYDKLFPIQMFIDGVEKYSNRPSFGGNSNLRYEAVGNFTTTTGQLIDVTFKLKYQFKVEVQGQLGFRILMPIFENGTGAVDGTESQTNLNFNCFFYCNALKLTALEGYEENEDTIAARNINYTQELDHDLEVSCTVDNSVLNSFKIGYPLNNEYFKTIDRSVLPYEIINYNYFSPTTLLPLNLDTFKINYNILNLLFADSMLKSCFIETATGEQSLFDSLWYYFNNPTSRLGYLTSFTGFPVIPKNYKAYPDVDPDDVLKYMHVQYAPENYANRLKWRLYGSDVVDTYPKTIAKALHGVQPEMIYRLEAQALKLLFPDCLIDFYFDNQDRNFIPTTLKLDLFNGKTSFVATEAKFTELTDITYE